LKERAQAGLWHHLFVEIRFSQLGVYVVNGVLDSFCVIGVVPVMDIGQQVILLKESERLIARDAFA
jgi:hypothetical protein